MYAGVPTADLGFECHIDDCSDMRILLFSENNIGSDKLKVATLTMDPANNLGITKITYLEPRGWAAIQENIL
jgi:hypothetical protein